MTVWKDRHKYKDSDKGAPVERGRENSTRGNNLKGEEMRVYINGVSCLVNNLIAVIDYEAIVLMADLDPSKKPNVSYKYISTGDICDLVPSQKAILELGMEFTIV